MADDISSGPGADADSARPTAGPSLSGNDAVNLAAEQAKHTASRNIPGLEDSPIVNDTANLRQGPNLHDGLLALLPLVGVWRGSGQADTAEGGQFAFGQELIFAHDGENYLTFSSRIWRIDGDGAPTALDERESGFWRISPSDDIEFICTHSTGVVEIFYGRPASERSWELQAASTMVTETGPATLGPGKRLYGLMPNNHLGWVDERLVDGKLRPGMSAELVRVVG